MSSFESFWQKFYGQVPPLGHMLRAAFPDRWIRFHALPESKRYPETKAEEEEILRRGNALATHVLQSESQCWLSTGVATWFADENDGPSEFYRPYQMTRSFDWNPSDSESQDGEPTTFYATSTTWVPGNFDDLLLEIANWREKAILADNASGRVFAPYDGGFDLICTDQDDVMRLKSEFGSWMSAREDWM